MDHDHTMKEALLRKGHQYDQALDAIQRAQHGVPLKDQQVSNAVTLPLVFGVRGSVAYAEACSAFEWFKLSPAKRDRILACGVREAIKGANDMCNARFAALRVLPGPPRLANGRRAKIVIPPKPTRPQQWRADRGGG